MTSKKLALAAAEAAKGKKGAEVVVLDLRKVSLMCDYFVIAGATSKVQARAMTDYVEDTLEELQGPARRRSGYAEGSWIVLDYGDVVVHLMLDLQRRFYDLEGLWAKAKRVYP